MTTYRHLLETLEALDPSAWSVSTAEDRNWIGLRDASGRTYCPLTCFAFVETGDYYKENDPWAAGKAAGFGDVEIEEIISAADYELPSESRRRRELEAALWHLPRRPER